MPPSQIQTALPQRQAISKWISWALVLLSFLGFADSAFLSAEALVGEIPTCVLFSGCDVVATSPYSHVGPVPIAVFGVLFYLCVFILSVISLDRRKPFLLKAVFAIALPAFLYTLYLMYLQLFILHAICVYCAFSAITSTAVFAVSSFGVRRLL